MDLATWILAGLCGLLAVAVLVLATWRLRAESAVRHEMERRLAERDRALRDVFGSLASETLQASTRQFLDLARQSFEADRQGAAADLERRRTAVDDLVRPLGESLRKTDEKLADIERQRIAAFAALDAQLKGMSQAGEGLRQETARLVRSLRVPQVRGRWGEMQLQRVAELAGMSQHCDFALQASHRDGHGRLLRPDMIVRLPNGATVVVDAKTSLEGYLDALEAESTEAADACLDRFARHVGDQVAALARKGYWQGHDGAVELTVLFLPGDQLLDAALRRRPDLLERAAEQGVVLASPATLIALLRAVAIGWREQRLAEEARELLQLGRELHDRAAMVLGHVAGLGQRLRQAIGAFNQVVGSIEQRLVPNLRRFEEAGVRSSKDRPELSEITDQVRRLSIEVEGGDEESRGDSPPSG